MRTRISTSAAVAVVAALLLGGCTGAPLSPGSTEGYSCPSADELPSAASGEVAFEAGSGQVLEPMGFGELAGAACVYEAVDYPGLGDIATVIYVNPDAAQVSAFMNQVQEAAAAHGFSANVSDANGQEVKGENGEFDYYQFNVHTVNSDIETAYSVFGAHEGDLLILGSVVARDDQNG